MDVELAPDPPYAFEAFELDPRRMLLTCAGAPVLTTPRIVMTLLYLVEHAGRTVTRDEMLRSLWPGRIAEEANLSQAVSAVRKLLAAEGGSADWIVTVPGQGYRFTARVSRERPLSTPPHPAAPASRPPGGLRRRSALWLAGALVVVAVAVVGAGAFFWRSPRPPPPPGQRTEVVVAELRNETGDPKLDHVVPRVLQIDLAQSPFLQVATDAKVAALLGLMEKPRSTALSEPVAKEVCARDNGGSVVVPTAARLGSSYLVTLAAADCLSGQTVFEDKAVASSKDDLARVLDGLCDRLRLRLGEAQSSISHFDVPLEAEKTSSFDALAAYSQGVWMHAHDRETDAIAAFRHATELDPNFAMAYDGLYNPLYVTKQQALAEAAITRAYELSRSVSDRDRLLIGSHYHFFVQHDLFAALADLKLLTGLYPKDAGAWATLSNVENWLGDYTAAIAAGERTLSLNPNTTAPYSTLARALNHGGQTARALKVDELAVARGVAGGDTRGQMIAETFILGQTARSRSLVDQAKSTPLERDALLQLSDLDFALGKVREASAVLAKADALGRPEGLSLDPAGDAEEFEDDGLIEPALRKLAQVAPDQRDGSYYAAAAMIDAPGAVAAGLQGLLAAKPHDTLLHAFYAPIAQARLRLRQGEAAAAVQALDLSPPAALHDISAYYQKGLAQLAAGDPAGAAGSFRTVLGQTGFAYITPYFLAHLGLARALARTGDAPGARREYEAFLSAWSGADADLSSLQQAKAEYGRLHVTAPRPGA